MFIQHKEGHNRGMFFIAEDEEILAEIVYSMRSDNTLVIEHTEVEETLQGRNIGYELVHRVVDYARTHGKKISPVCPFAKAVIDKKADWKELLV